MFLDGKNMQIAIASFIKHQGLVKWPAWFGRGWKQSQNIWLKNHWNRYCCSLRFLDLDENEIREFAGQAAVLQLQKESVFWQDTPWSRKSARISSDDAKKTCSVHRKHNFHTGKQSKQIILEATDPISVLVHRGCSWFMWFNDFNPPRHIAWLPSQPKAGMLEGICPLLLGHKGPYLVASLSILACYWPSNTRCIMVYLPCPKQWFGHNRRLQLQPQCKDPTNHNNVCIIGLNAAREHSRRSIISSWEVSNKMVSLTRFM